MRACDQCPWRLQNQGKKHPFKFYTMANLKRLWGQVRRGGAEQSCHLTDPSHPDHIAAGAREGSTPRECPGSVIVVLREVRSMVNADGVVDAPGVKAYLTRRKKHGITKQGVLYWVISRMQLGGVPVFGGPKMLTVVDDPEVGLPEAWREG